MSANETQARADEVLATVLRTLRVRGYDVTASTSVGWNSYYCADVVSVRLMLDSEATRRDRSIANHAVREALIAANVAHNVTVA